MKNKNIQLNARNSIPWEDPKFYDLKDLEAESRRIFDICHGCRLCFNLCNSFPRLFDLIDETKTGELEEVESKDFHKVSEACTLCDICYSVTCPYTPPHEYALDFPHLMLRYKAIDYKNNKNSLGKNIFANTDFNGNIACKVSGLANWGTDVDHKVPRLILEKIMGLDKRAALPKFSKKTFMNEDANLKFSINKKAPAYKSKYKVILFPTCYTNYNNPNVGVYIKEIFAKNGIDLKSVYPACCGMPYLENGNLTQVTIQAQKFAEQVEKYIEEGYSIITPTPSCTLMLKQEWPLLLPNNEIIKKISAQTFDVCEFLVKIHNNEGLARGIQEIDKTIVLHLACHSRAQSIGDKAFELLELIPKLKIELVRRCSGHGGIWGYMKENFDTASRVGGSATRQIESLNPDEIVSECPLAGIHLKQNLENIINNNTNKQLPAYVRDQIAAFNSINGAKALSNSTAEINPLQRTAMINDFSESIAVLGEDAIDTKAPTLRTHPIEILAQSYRIIPL